MRTQLQKLTRGSRPITLPAALDCVGEGITRAALSETVDHDFWVQGEFAKNNQKSLSRTGNGRYRFDGDCVSVSFGASPDFSANDLRKAELYCCALDDVALIQLQRVRNWVNVRVNQVNKIPDRSAAVASLRRRKILGGELDSADYVFDVIRQGMNAQSESFDADLDWVGFLYSEDDTPEALIQVIEIPILFGKIGVKDIVYVELIALPSINRDIQKFAHATQNINMQSLSALSHFLPNSELSTIGKFEIGMKRVKRELALKSNAEVISRIVRTL